ncbi:IclR family transcriptional regulator [Lentibacillus halophilus]|uniref:IclR family transcriptional regulator n=1 Tax=Lentibacillus halophilus TaxID=295065 RepID=A0ABP3J4Y7_9BACI
MNQEFSNSQGIQALERAVLILDEIKNNDGPITLTALSHKVGMSKNNLKKYLVSFVKSDVLTFDDDKKTYDMGSKLIELGLYTLNKFSISSIIDPFMQKIKKEIKHSSALAVWTDNGPMISKYQSSGRSINVGIEIGYYPPLLMSSVGRCFAAFLPNQSIQDIMNRDIEDYHLDRKAVEDDLNRVREAGFASRDQEFGDLPGGHAVSSPIFDHSGEMIAAICMIGFANDLNTDAQSYDVQRLIEITKEISDQLTYK